MFSINKGISEIVEYILRKGEDPNENIYFFYLFIIISQIKIFSKKATIKYLNYI